MSLLHQDAPGEQDTAALGEELTQGSGHLVLGGMIAAVVVTIVIAIYVISGEKPPPITGEVEQVWVYPMHTVTSGFDANGDPMPKEDFDQVLVLARLKLHNQSQTPRTVLDILTNATFSDGIHSSYVASTTQYNELFLAHRELAAYQGHALSPQMTIDAGQTVEGDIVSAFRMTREQWETHKDLNFTVTIRYQPKLVLTPHVPVTEVP